MVMAKKQPLSELCKGFIFYPQVLKNVRVAEKANAQNDEDVQAAVAHAAALGNTGRILVRESGAEPVIRVMVEAEDHARITTPAKSTWIRYSKSSGESLAVVPLQLPGYYVSVAKGLDVEKPRNLAKKRDS